MYMYIKYKLSDFVYDFVHANIRTCTKVYYSFIRKCTADIGHRTFQPYRDLEEGDNQSLKFQWRDRESNPDILLRKQRA